MENEVYRRTKKGLTSCIYNHQKKHSKKRNHEPPKYTMLQLREWCFSQELFHDLYDDWVKSKYKKDLYPSIDRKYDYEGYSFDNIQLMTWRENNIKAKNGRIEGINCTRGKTVLLYKNGEYVKSYHSLTQAGVAFGIPPYYITVFIKYNFLYKGFIWKFKKK